MGGSGEQKEKGNKKNRENKGNGGTGEKRNNKSGVGLSTPFQL